MGSYFEVTVNDSLFVHVVDGFQNLPDEIRCILFRIRSFLDDAVKQFPTSHSILKKKKQVMYIYRARIDRERRRRRRPGNASGAI